MEEEAVVERSASALFAFIAAVRQSEQARCIQSAMQKALVGGQCIRSGWMLVCVVLLALPGGGHTAWADEAVTVLTPVQKGIHDATLKDLGGGEWELRITGAYPYLFFEPEGEPIDLKVQPIFSFEYFSTTGLGTLSISVGSVPPRPHEADLYDFPHLIPGCDLGISQGWASPSVDLTRTRQPPNGPVTSLRIMLGNWKGNAHLRAICVRPATQQEKHMAVGDRERNEQDLQHAIRLTDYLKQNFPDQVMSVSADDSRIQIEGRLSQSLEGIFLAEVPMWQDVTDLTTPETLLPIEPDGNGRFQVTIDRGGKGERDRLLSGWAIVRNQGDRYTPLSALHYVDAVKARANLPPARPRSRKGLGGFPFTSDRDDLEALGLGSVTLNIVLNDILSTEQGPDRTPYRYAGRIWYVNDRNVARYDAEMQAIAKHSLMVSAILLILPAGNAPEGSWAREAAHPDADPSGIFVMPNFTTRAGVDAYAAAMNFVAERYSRPDGKYGRVHHWILHNEINSGFYWTTAGNRLHVTYLDLYQKSMRLAYLIARQYDPHSKPFISLDHCWTKTPDRRSYAGRDLMDLLVDFSHREGDFPWGIAFHPYPQDIFNPRTWLDSEASFRFNTPYITFKNLEVLDAWARLPRVAFRGHPREIQLSEEGLNSPDYSPESLAEQAAGLAYAWKKIEPLKTITAFQYHLWADEPSEGGLRLGLRKFAGDHDDPLGKKPAWLLFQAAGTSDWEKSSRFALPILGIKSWSEVHYTDKIR